MEATDLRLRPLRLDDEDAALAAHATMLADGFHFLFDQPSELDWPAYVRGLERRRRGDELVPGWVRDAFLLAVVGPAIVGRASIRFELNDGLRREGGHIGYGVLPEFRRRGMATEILRQSLIVARAEGVDEALVTCDDDNVGSSGAIERCGGVLLDVTDAPEPGGRRIRRYVVR